jgi:hypothetical protein
VDRLDTRLLLLYAAAEPTRIRPRPERRLLVGFGPTVTIDR